jgi:GT2 family glycosyltransferase
MTRETRSHLDAVDATVVTYSRRGEFNYSAKMNFALTHVKTEDVIFLNDDLEVISNDWIEALIGFSRQTGIGAVGARLIYPNRHTQHAGIVLGVNETCAHVFYDLAPSEVGYCGYDRLIRNYSAVTAAVMATRMSIVRSLGGFDEQFGTDFNDVDLCLRMREQGLRIVYTPFAELFHFEGKSFKRTTQKEEEQAAFKLRWGKVLAADPYYNPGLPRDRVDCKVTSW